MNGRTEPRWLERARFRLQHAGCQGSLDAPAQDTPRSRSMATSRYALLLLMGTGGCGFPRPQDVVSEPSDASMGADGAGGQARCDSKAPFGTATLVETINSSHEEYGFSLTHDEMTGFIGHDTGGSPNTFAIYTSRRASTTATFGIPDDHVTSAINATGNVISGSASLDGLIFYFHRQNPQVSTDIAVLAARRSDSAASFDAGTQITVDGAPLLGAIGPKVSADGVTLYWLDFSNNQYGKMFTAVRGASFTEFTGKRAVSTLSLGSEPVLSADELTLYYSLDNNTQDVYATTRPSKAEAFGPGVPVANVNSAANDKPVALTSDGCILYIISQRAGGVAGYDVWAARRPQ
jgi:hypothetical protein